LSLGSTAFLDLNNDGIQSGAGETGIAGLTVNLYDAAAPTVVVATTTTDGAGNYVFNGLEAGNYIVGMSAPVAAPNASTAVTANSGVAGDIDGVNTGTQVGGAGTESRSGTIALVAGAQPVTESGQGAAGLTSADADGNATIDFGFYDPTTLPIDLINFNGSQIEGQINLTWKVANEKDFSHFELERSEDAKEFGSIATITGEGKSTYNYSDLQPTEGDNYYRLRMVDLSGKFSVSKKVNINFEKNGNYVAVENPANNGQFKVMTNLKNAKFTLVNSLGVRINSTLTDLGGNNYQIKVIQPIPGLYYLNIESNGKLQTKKVLIP
jgi:SdrD B-like domain